MRKFGIHKVKPHDAAESQPKVRNVLLQTYFTGLLSLILCVAMFFGTSYAWFTSEVNNTVNEICIGILDAELKKQVSGGDSYEYVSLSDMDAAQSSVQNLFDRNIRWEPGYTALETIRVVNTGNLAFNYVLSFTVGSSAESKEDEIYNVAKNFEVWVFDHNKNKWENAVSLDELLKGEPVLEGTMEATGNDNAEISDTYIIALHMKEEADVSVMGQKIALNVKLVAYQHMSEQNVSENENNGSNAG